MTDTVLIDKFIKQLKHKIHIKSNVSMSPEKTLLEAFKYYDYEKTGKSDFKTFTKLVKIKLSINVFSNEEMMMIYDYFQNKFDSGDNCLFYRELIKDLYNVDVTLNSVRKDDNTSVYSNTRSFTGNKNDLEDTSKEPKKLVDFIVFKLRKKSLASFLKLYVDMRNSDPKNYGDIGLNQLVKCLRKSGFDMKEESVENIWYFFHNQVGKMEYEKMWDYMCTNFSSVRQKLVLEMFSKLDINHQKYVNINLLRELFNPRNYFDVKSSRKTIEEVQMGFDDYVSLFPTTINGETLLSQKNFLSFFKFLSAYIEDNKNFENFIEVGFRYNELKKYQEKSLSGFKSKIQNLEYEKSRTGEITSLKTELRPDNILLELEEQISKKGNKGYINFFKSLRGNDFDRDGYLYLKEWQKTLKEQRINLEENQIQSIFKHYSGQSQKMNYELLLDKLIPGFLPNRIQMLKSLYEDLFKGESKNELSFYKLQNSFNSRGHPDFRGGLRADYEIKNEFIEGFQTFLLNLQGNHISVPLFAFVRFFEFFSRDWEAEYFENVVYNCFSQRSRIQPKTQAPYGVDEENSLQMKNAKNVPVSHRSKYYDEYVEDKKTYKPNYPYFTSNDNQKNAFKKKKTLEDDFKENQESYPKQEKNVPIIESKRFEKSRRSNKKNDNSLYSRPLEEKFEEAPNSPDNGSLISYSKNEKSIYDLNRRIQESIVNEQDRIYDNLNHNSKFSLNSDANKLGSIIKTKKNVVFLLELEYELTNKSSLKGTIDFDNFIQVLKKMNIFSEFSNKDLKNLFDMNTNEDNLLHVQLFANNIRGQMNENRENWVIELFERLTSKTGSDIIQVDNFRKSFIAREFTYSKEKNLGDISEMFEFMIDLFVCLNLTIKERDFFDLDDFLYFFDNFSFYIDNDNSFRNMLKTCFK
jgi:Ca2+-binding EF-hand superfamily protein